MSKYNDYINNQVFQDSFTSALFDNCFSAIPEWFWQMFGGESE